MERVQKEVRRQPAAGERGEMVPAICRGARGGNLLCSSKNIKWTEVAGGTGMRGGG